MKNSCFIVLFLLGIIPSAFAQLIGFEEDIEDSHNVLKNANYEAGAHIKYLEFEG